tara:strand:- start:253 stop:495 length:243 start_codon:yes stop_codon:yes gene_type:complete
MKELQDLDNPTFLRSVDRSHPEVRELAERLERTLSVMASLLDDYEHSMEVNKKRIEVYKNSLANVRQNLEEKLNENERND